METSRGGDELSALKLSVGLYLVVFVLKLVAFLASGVMAVLAEALHTLSDIFVSGFLLIAVVISRRRADSVHAYGHARAQNVAALVAATLFISFTSFKLVEESIPRLMQSEAPEYQNLPLALGVLVVSMLIAAAPLAQLLLQKQRGAAAKAQLLELVNDELGLLAALVGTLLAVAGWHIADPLAALVVAAIIAINGVRLFVENVSYLLGRSPEPEVLARIEDLVRAVPGVLDVHDLRAEYAGPETLHAELHIAVRRGVPIEEADRIAEEAHDRVQQNTACQYCTIHVDPAEAEAVAKARAAALANEEPPEEE